MKYGYARVSARDQNLDLQLDALKKAGCEKFFTDKASGAKADRPELNKMLEEAREDDVIVIWKLDRLGRFLKHLVELVDQLSRQQVGLVSLNDPIDTTFSRRWPNLKGTSLGKGQRRAWRPHMFSHTLKIYVVFDFSKTRFFVKLQCMFEDVPVCISLGFRSGRRIQAETYGVFKQERDRARRNGRTKVSMAA